MSQASDLLSGSLAVALESRRPPHANMLIDLRKHAAAAIFDCDIAIVGTGAAGWANPTLTILALTHRLGDHVHARWA